MKNSSRKRRKKKILRNPVRNIFLDPKNKFLKTGIGNLALKLYKLIESVVLKQTKDQYPVAAVWDQYSSVFNARQGSLPNTEWYEKFNTKVEVAESVGCVFGQDKILDYCAELEFKSQWNGLSTAERKVVEIQAREQFMAYGLLLCPVEM